MLANDDNFAFIRINDFGASHHGRALVNTALALRIKTGVHGTVLVGCACIRCPLLQGVTRADNSSAPIIFAHMLYVSYLELI